MAGPIAGAGAISAALLTSSRAILGPKKTAEYAIKGAKFLSRQVEKAKKLMNKPTAGQIKAEVPTKGTRAYAKGQAKAVAGTAGVTVPLGALAYVSKGSGVKTSKSKTPNKKPNKKPTTARVKRAIKPLDAGNKKINNAIKKTATNDKTAIKFALGGAGLYAAANEVSNRVKGSDKTASKSKTPNKKPTTARGTPASNKPAAKKGLSPFEKEFSEARKTGRKTFTYKGDLYNTKLKTKVTPPTKKKKK